MELKFDNKRYRVKYCPCNKSNKDGKFVPYENQVKYGYCHSCDKTYLPKKNNTVEKYIPPIRNKKVDVIITTGGTGLTGRDSTPEAIAELSNKIIDGFGELFRQLSYEKIGTSTIQSRAIAAVINHTYVFALPGSPGACKDGWDDILQYQLDIRHKPCNFIEIMPRLKEK